MRAFRLIDQERAHHAVSGLCSVLKVIRQGYYAWKQRAPSARRLRDDELKVEILALYERSRDTYGAPRIHAESQADGEAVGRKRVARLMRAADLAGVSRRRGVVTTRRDRDARPAPDLVSRR